MIRLRNIFFLLLLMLLALPIASRAKDVFYIQPFNIVPGDTKTISLNLDNANGYRGFQTDIVLPEGLSIVKQTNNSLAISPTSRASSFALSFNEIGDRTTRLLCYSAQYETISGNSGALVNIQVKASSDFAGGYVQLKNTIFSNENNQDVNMDDSQVSVQTKEQNFISVADDEVTAGKGKAFALQLTNETSLTACQFDVAVPSGLSLDLEKCSVTGRCSSSHQLTSKDLGNGRYRFVCMSMDNTTFVGHSGTILNLWVNAEASARDHKKVKVENVVFSDAKAQTYRFEPISFDVNVSFVVATSIRLSESSLSLQVDDSRTLTATVLPENCTDKSVVWESSNEQVATVDANGKVIAKAEGQCQIIAYSADRSVKAECAVTVTKIPLTVRVEDVSRKYGDENPQFKISYEGFRDGDTETRLTTSAVAQTDANLKSAVGDYEIILSGAESNKYSFNYVAGTLTITKAPLTISAGNYTKKQGDAMPAFKASYDGFKNGETESVLTKQPVFSTDANEASSPAEYAVNVSSAEAENYEISYQPGTLTVTEADAVIIRAKSYTRQYGDANPTFEYEVEGAALDGTPEVVCSAVSDSPVGTYTIEVRQGSVKNYNVHFENGTLTITKAPLVISAGSYTKKQGDAMPELKASYGGFKNGENETVLTKQPVFSTEANESSSPADYVVNVSGAEAENYEITYQPGTLTVTEADAVIIRAKSFSRQYGDANPIFEYEVEGVALDGTPEFVCSAADGSPVGTYTIEVRQGSVKNYNVHFENGTLTITKAPLVISAGSYTKKQGDAMPEFKASYSGFKNGETESVLTKQPVFSTDANEASSPAEYAVNVSSAEAENYEISYQPGTLTVTEADAVIIRAKNYTRQYGDANPVFEYEVEGAALEGTPELTCSAVANSPVGTYTIELSKGSVKNYNVHFENGTMTITKAPLTISAGNYTKKQGDAMPAFKASYDGFKNGETESVLTKQPVFSTDANEASSPAEYAVNVSSAEAENYEISYQPGTMTVTEADAVVIRAKSYSRQYGDANPTFEYEVEGVALDGTPELVCSAAVGSSIGTYTIEVRQGSVKNYNVHFENGTLTITKAPLVISAGSYTKKQGDAMPELKASYGGFKNGENETVLTKQPVFSTEANESSSPADYVVNVSGAEATNYDITYQPGTLTVTEMPAPILSVVNKELQISTELADAIIYYTLDGTNPDENSKVYSAPISLYASCMIKAIVVKNGVKSKIAETEYHDAQYPDIVKVGDLITANIINNGEENLPMLFSVTSVYPFEVTLLNKEEYVEGWRNEQLIGDIEVPAFVTSNGVSFAVKSIGRRALCASGKVTSLKLNEGLEYIAQEALRTIGRIKKLVIPNSVKEIGSANIIDDMNLNTMVLGKGVEILHFNAFWSTNVPLKEIYSLNPVPPVCGAPDITFEGMPDGVTLYVPIGSKEAYETAPGWNHFAGHIVEINPTAIKPVVISIKDNTSWYNLRGVRSLEKPTAPGIYIHGGKKVIIK